MLVLLIIFMVAAPSPPSIFRSISGFQRRAA
jgi:biopolymer transport protein ExbD